MARGRWAVAFVLALVLLAGPRGSAHAGLISGSVSLDTSGLAGPFELAFVFTDGSGSGDANNTVTLSSFLFGAGGSAGTVDTTLSMGGQSGDLGSSVSLIDSSFLNIFASSFTPGSALSFNFALTTNVDTGGIPDQFSMVLLQADGVPVGSEDPSRADSLLTIDIDSANPVFSAFAGELTPAPVVQVAGSVPEPATLALLGLGLAGVGFSRRLR